MPIAHVAHCTDRWKRKRCWKTVWQRQLHCVQYLQMAQLRCLHLQPLPGRCSPCQLVMGLCTMDVCPLRLPWIS